LLANQNISRKLVIAAAIGIIAIIIVDVLATRQLLYYDNFSGAVLFAFNIIIAYGVGSLILLKYVGNVSQDIRKGSKLLRILFKIVSIVQVVFLAVMATMLVQFYYYDVSVRYLSYFVFSTSTIVAAGIMSLTGFKFFSWYRQICRNSKSNSSNSNDSKTNYYLILICGFAAASLAAAMIIDATSKMFLVSVVEEKSMANNVAASSDAFIYRENPKYGGEVQYKVIKPQTTTTYVVPFPIVRTYQFVNGWIPITISFVFTWTITCILLHQHFDRRPRRLRIIYVVLLVLPIILYMVGRAPDWYTAITGRIWHWEDFPNPYLLKAMFRAGTIGGSILFGIVFLLVSRPVTADKLKNYLTIAAIGAAMIGITLTPSALQQTFGVAGHSLIMVASFLFSYGFYLSAASMAQDNILRNSIKAITGSEMFRALGTAQQRQQLEKKIIETSHEVRNSIKEQAGIEPPLEKDIKLYLEDVLREMHSHKSGSSAA